MNDRASSSRASSSNSCYNYTNPVVSGHSSNSVDSIDFEIANDRDATINSRISISAENRVKTDNCAPQKRASKKSLVEKSSVLQLHKFCRVCGDKALGYNFDVVTCESCKAFFRRNALKSKNFRCPFNNDCDVSIVSRRFCQKCRLKKCFEVGMKKESIMSEQDRLLKRRKRTASNPRKEANERECPSLANSHLKADAPGSDSSPKNSLEMPIVSGDDHVTISKSTLIMLLNNSKKQTATKCCVCRCACGARPQGTLLFPAQKDQSTNTQNLDEFPNNNRPCSSRQSVIYSSAVHQNRKRIFSAEVGDFLSRSSVDSLSAPNGSDYGDVHEISILDRNISNVDQLFLLQNHHNDPNLLNNVAGNAETVNFASAAGQFLFNEAVDAAISRELAEEESQAIGSPGGGVYRLNAEEENRLTELMAANEIFEEPMESGDARSLTDFVNLMDIGIRRIIRMAKRIDSFKNLCKEDQIALLKGGCVELMVLRGVMAFDPVKDTWRGPKSYCIKSENVREVKGDVYDEYKKYFHSFEENLRTNEAIMVILLAVTLFICERPNVQHKDLIRSEQSTYVELLKNYLNSIYDQKRAVSAYERLMLNLDDLHKLTKKVVSIFLHVNPRDVEPLLLEMFDWKR